MVDRIPLIVNAGASQIQELPVADDLVLSGQLKMTGSTSGASDILVSGGNDGHCVMTVTGHNSNVSILTIDGRGNAGGGGAGSASNIAEFIMTNTTAQLNCKGDITAFASSDKNLKDNITPIPNALNKVLSVSGNTFTWNEKSIYSGEKGTGVIAQEVEKVLPEVVSEDDDGMKSVAYGNMVGLLIEAIKDQQKQIDELKEIINGNG